MGTSTNEMVGVSITIFETPEGNWVTIDKLKWKFPQVLDHLK